MQENNADKDNGITGQNVNDSSAKNPVRENSGADGNNIRKAVSQLLLDIGISPSMRGFRDIVRCVELMHNNPKLKIMEVYSIVGNEYGKRSCNTVYITISAAIKRADPESKIYQKYKTLHGIEKQRGGKVLYQLLNAVDEMMYTSCDFGGDSDASCNTGASSDARAGDTKITTSE